MTHKRTLISIIPTVLIIGLVIFPIFGLSLTRQEYAVEFIKSTQDDIRGAFSEYNQYSSEETYTQSVLSTRSAIIALDILGALEDIDTSSTDNWILDHINWGIDFNSLQNISECIESLYHIDQEAATGYARIEDFKEFADNLQVVDGDLIGYAINSGLDPSIFGTYYIVKTYYFLDILTELDIANISAFIYASLDVDGGFKSSPNDSGSSLSTTFYAVQTLWYLDSLSLLSVANLTSLTTYINSHYVFDESLQAHYGGYSYNPESEVQFATVRATFDAIVSLSLLDRPIHEKQSTIDWLLGNQNQEDGGFSENVLEGIEKRSSTITTYQSIRILNELGELDLLSESFGDYKLRWWIVLIVVLVVLGAGIGGYIYYQRRIKL